MAKEAKQSANYGPGHPGAHCGICRHFEPPHACEIVAGRIVKSAWCKHFLAKSTRQQKRYGEG
jgi:hypothetical protein